MVFVADDAHGVAGFGQLAGGLLRLEDPGAGGIDDLESLGALHPLELVAWDAMRADDERASLDLVREVGGADAAVGEVGLDARVMDQLAEGGDLLALGPRVLRLVDREAHAVAEAGAFRDADVGSDGNLGGRSHRFNSRGDRRYIRIYAAPVNAI